MCRALLARKGPRIDAPELSFHEPVPCGPEGKDEEEPPLELPEGVTLEQMMQRLERQLVESTLRRCGNHHRGRPRPTSLASASNVAKFSRTAS